MPSGRKRLGIRGKLLFAFASLGAMTVVASLVALLSFIAVGNPIEDVARVQLPQLTLARELAAESSALAAGGPAIETARDPLDLRIQSAALYERADHLIHLAEELRRLRPELAPIETGAKSIGENVQALYEAVTKVIELRNREEATVEALGDRHERFLGALAPRISAVNVDVRGRPEKRSSSVRAQVRSLKSGVRDVIALQRLRADVVDMADGMLRAADAANTGTVQDLRNAHARARRKVKEAVAAARRRTDPRTLAAITQLAGVGDGENGLFETKERALARPRWWPARVPLDRRVAARAEQVKALKRQILAQLNEASRTSTARVGRTGNALETRTSRSVRQLQTYADLATASNLVVSTLNEAAQAPSVNRLEAVRTRFHEMGADFSKLLPPPGRDSGLREQGIRLLEYGKGSRGVFELRKADLRATSAAHAIAEANRGIADRLQQDMQSSLNGTQFAARNAILRGEEVMRSASLSLIAIAVLSLAAAIATAWYFSGRAIVTRITRLSAAMRTIAAGDLQSPIPGGGDDEISDMAQALAVLRDRSRIATVAAERIEAERQRASEAHRIARLANWRWDPEGGLVWSEEIRPLLEADADRLGSALEDFLRLVHPEDRAMVAEAMEKARVEGKSFALDLRLTLGGDRTLVVHLNAEATFGAEGKPARVSGTLQDVSERKRMEEKIELLAAEERALSGVLQLALDRPDLTEFLRCSLDPLFEVLPQRLRCAAVLLGQAGEPSLRVAATRRAQVAGGGDFAEICGDCLCRSGAASCQSLFPGSPADRATVRRLGTMRRYHLRILSGKETIGALIATVAQSAVTDDLSFFGRVADVLSMGIGHRRAEAEVVHRAFHDALTNLPNRLLLEERLQHEMRVALRTHCRGALFFLDLDNFKSLNDTLGHSAGDALLVQVARRLQETMRDMDTVARLGGDEFVALSPALSEDLQAAADRAQNIAGKLRAALNVPYDLAGHRLRVTPSIGVALFPDDAGDAETLLKHADTAMYHSKAEGRNRIHFFQPAMQSAVQARHELEGQLRLALERDQLSLDYQPLFDVNGELVGAEALVRWHHPERGDIEPELFISLAEETGLIVELGQHVLQDVARQLHVWQAGSLMDRRHVAVNISPRHFHQQDFNEVLRAIFQEARADLSGLVLEITESVLIRDPAHMVRKMEELRALGVRFYIDDFGTGYSSMSYLKRLPVDGLKIDQSFVRDLTVDPNDAAIVEAIAAIGRRFHLEVIAEGVETEEQLAHLRGEHCDIYQGYFLARPMPAAAFAEEYLRTAHA